MIFLNEGNMKHEDILKYFDNVRSGNSMLRTKYIVFDKHGNDVAELIHYQNEWTIYIDHFPEKNLYYKYNFPIKDIKQFSNDMLRLGLILQYKKTICESCQKIKDCQGYSICDDCEIAELN